MFTYIRCLNNDPAWIAALAELCRRSAVLPV
jgi:protoheme ferro-lyase